MKVLSTIFSLEALFVLLLLAGRIKADQRMPSLEVDLTLLLVIVFCIAATVSLVKGGWVIKKLALFHATTFALFILYMSASALWSLSTDYRDEKMIRLIGVVAIPYFIVLSSITTRDRVLRLMILIFAAAIGIAVDGYLVYLSDGWSELVAHYQGNYIDVSRFAGVAVIWLYLGLISRQREIPVSFMLFGGVALLGYMFLLGSRSALVVLALTLVLVQMAKIRLSPNALLVSRGMISLVVIALFTAGAITVLVAVDIELPVIDRFHAAIVEPSGGDSIAARMLYIAGSLDAARGSLLNGVGLGGWTVAVFGIDERGYPHNILLEILVEGGIVGLLFFAAWLVSLAICRTRMRHEVGNQVAVHAVWWATIYLFLNAMFSGDITDNRWFFLFAALTASGAAPRFGKTHGS